MQQLTQLTQLLQLQLLQLPHLQQLQLLQLQVTRSTHHLRAFAILAEEAMPPLRLDKRDAPRHGLATVGPEIGESFGRELESRRFVLLGAALGAEDLLDAVLRVPGRHGCVSFP
jgi:hypothetical protein